MHRDSILVRLSSFDNCETGDRRRRCCSSCNAGMREAGGKMISLTKRTLIGATIAALALIVTPAAATAQSAAPAPANFEPSQTNPIRLSADGKFLFAVNTANSSLSVFDVTQPGNPQLLAEIPVGLGPVSVNPRTDNEAWVVNQVSNTISVVSAGVGGSWAKGLVTGTIYLKVPLSGGMSAGEPMDVVFAGNAAYVSVSRAHEIAVINTKTQALTSTIQVFGDSPRAMAVSKDGSTVYAAFALAGNATTLIPNVKAPPQCGTAAQGRQPCIPAMNPLLPPAPIAGLVVAASDPAWSSFITYKMPANGRHRAFPAMNPLLPPAPIAGLVVAASDPAWSSFITYKMPANGVVAIKTGASPSISYYSKVGTINLGLAVNPVTGDLFVANTDALNLILFENNLCGHIVNNRITRIQVATGTITPFDLNPKVVY